MALLPDIGGERARTIDELPLDWFLRPGVRLDVREVPWGERIEVAHLEAALGEYALQPYDIVLLWTGADEKWDTTEYFNAGSGLTRESTTWLLEQGVKVIGTDAWGLDRPFMALRAEYERTGTPRSCGRRTAPASTASTARSRSSTTSARYRAPTGFTVSCLPVKLAAASAGWCRAAAIVDE